MRLLRYKIVIVLFFSLFVISAALPAIAKSDKVRLYVPVFEGEKALGKNVATVLSLQIWRTLRMAPSPNPDNLNFGRGIVQWSNEHFDSQNLTETTKLAIGMNTQMILWGSAFEYGDGVIVQTYLSLPNYKDNRSTTPEIWTVQFPLSKKAFTISADIPRRQYEFSPIILSKSIVQQYISPDAIKIYDEKYPNKEIGTVGNDFKAIMHQGDKVLVKSFDNGKRGWVYLPLLYSQQNEVINFVGGLIRIYRGDWQGAQQLMQQVINSPKTPTTLKIDAYLYQALAKEKIGGTAHAELEKAMALNPYLKSTIKYVIMSDLERLKKAIIYRETKTKIKKIISKIKKIVDDNSFLFAHDDQWLTNVLALKNYLLTERLESILLEGNIKMPNKSLKRNAAKTRRAP